MGRPKTKQGVLSVDPFDVSQRPTPMQKTWAEWFTEITKNIPGQTYHIRRVHYQTLGKLKPDGTQYDNTINDSALLAKASEYARYLGMVDFDKIEDHKNEGVTVLTEYVPDDVITDFHIRSRSFTSSEIDELSECIDTWSSFDKINYHQQIRQPYHIEIWVEKSTMNDVLIPIARMYGCTLVVAGGQFSITNVKDLFNRIKDLNKPVRIFYLRDFDPAGETMAKAVSRKLEWFVRMRKPEIDVKLFDVALSHEQCEKYQLPRTPMDRSEKYKGNFEDKFGSGATELDSLEALHPGVLATLVNDAIKPYFDEWLNTKIIQFQNEEYQRYQDYKKSITNAVIDASRDRLNPLVASYNQIIREANELGTEIEQLIDSMECAPFKANIPSKSNLVVNDAKTPNALLDTKLDYAEQMKRYTGGAE